MGQSPGQDQNILGLLAELQNKIRRLELSVNTELDPGLVFDFAGSVAPTGYLMCDGTVYQITDYTDLFAVIGSAYGGNGVTTFATPDLRGRVPVGLDNMGGSDAGRLAAANTLGGSGGEELHALAIAEMPSHNHGGGTGTGSTGTGSTGTGSTGGMNANDPHSHLYDFNGSAAGGSGVTNPAASLSGIGTLATRTTSIAHGHSVPALSVPSLSVPSLSINSQGGGGSHNNMQPYILLNKIITT